MEIKNIKEELKKHLSPYRYDHSLRVAETAKSLAKHYHIDEPKAYITGLLHDIAKELSEEENQYWIEKYHLNKNLNEEKNRKIKHADIGAVIAKEKYHLDENCCNAIKYHTIGNKNMNTLAKIIYIADKIGREKIPEELKPVEQLAYKNIDEALLYCIEQQEKKLKEKGIKTHKDTKELLEKLKQK
jgi:nicotinate-nucleotide adenylyltransferase